MRAIRVSIDTELHAVEGEARDLPTSVVLPLQDARLTITGGHAIVTGVVVLGDTAVELELAELLGAEQ